MAIVSFPVNSGRSPLPSLPCQSRRIILIWLNMMPRDLSFLPHNYFFLSTARHFMMEYQLLNSISKTKSFTIRISLPKLKVNQRNKRGVQIRVRALVRWSFATESLVFGRGMKNWRLMKLTITLSVYIIAITFISLFILRTGKFCLLLRIFKESSYMCGTSTLE